MQIMNLHEKTKKEEREREREREKEKERDQRGNQIFDLLFNIHDFADKPPDQLENFVANYEGCNYAAEQEVETSTSAK